MLIYSSYGLVVVYILPSFLVSLIFYRCLLYIFLKTKRKRYIVMQPRLFSYCLVSLSFVSHGNVFFLRYYVYSLYLFNFHTCWLCHTHLRLDLSLTMQLLIIIIKNGNTVFSRSFYYIFNLLVKTAKFPFLIGDIYFIPNALLFFIASLYVWFPYTQSATSSCHNFRCC